MIEIFFKPTFIKQVGRLEKELLDEVFEKRELFKKKINHKTLKVHKLHGKLSHCFSFSVNYKFRIVFKYESKNKVVFLYIRKSRYLQIKPCMLDRWTIVFRTLVARKNFL